jgi:hypothetical protein
LDSLANARLRDAGKLVEDVTSISCKSVAAVAENRKGQKTPRNPPRSSWVQPAKFFPYPSHLVTSFAFCESTSASKPFKRFLEVLLARSELDDPEIANRSVEYFLGSRAFEAVAALRID